jgi:hypothetical protein
VGLALLLLLVSVAEAHKWPHKDAVRVARIVAKDERIKHDANLSSVR